MFAAEDKEQVRPLAIATPSPSIYVEEDPYEWQLHPRKFTNRDIILISTGCCAAVLAIVGLVLLAVALTVLKVRELEVDMKSASIKRMIVALPAFNMTVVADVSVKNPNEETLYLYDSTTELYYRGVLVAAAYAPAGTAPAHGTIGMNYTMDKFADKLLEVPEFAGDVVSGTFGLKSSTVVGGYVKIYGLFRHHLNAATDCSMTVTVPKQSILHLECRQHVRR